MKRPRVSIAMLMGLVVLVALDFGAYRTLDGATVPTVLTVLGGGPMANLLLLGVGDLLRRRRLRLPLGPAVGFELFGLLALIAAILSFHLTPDLVIDFAYWVCGPGLSRPGPWNLSRAMLIWLAPQLAVALLGYGLGRWYGRRRSRASSPPASLDA